MPGQLTLRQLSDLVTADDAARQGSDPACFAGLAAGWDASLWPAMRTMLDSHDNAQIGTALRMLAWRPDIASHHADILPALVALLADPTVPPLLRYRIKPLVLAFGAHALVALPLFMADAADAQANLHRPDVAAFLALSERSASPLDPLIALLDAETATLDAKMVAARHIGRVIPGAAHAVPALQRTIEQAHARPRQSVDPARLAGLVGAYLASEQPAPAARYLVTLRARDPDGVLAGALGRQSYQAYSAQWHAEPVALFDQPALSLAAARTFGAQWAGPMPAGAEAELAEAKLQAMLADPASPATPSCHSCGSGWNRPVACRWP
jgi:hypothetical protein